MSFDYDDACSTGSVFEFVAGYRRGIRKGDFIYLAGITGFDYEHMTIAPSLDTQVAKALSNMSDALERLGAQCADIVQLNWVVTHREHFIVAGPIIKEYFDGEAPPQMTLVSNLVDSRMLFEVQATAMLRNPSTR